MKEIVWFSGFLALLGVLGTGCKDEGLGTSCGNGILESPEDCDGLALGMTSCQDLGFIGGDLLCSDLCTFDPSNCIGLCGNEVVDSGEECDGTDLDGSTCHTLGWYMGTLACTPGCSFDTSECGNIAPWPDCPDPGPDGDICALGNALYFVEPAGDPGFMEIPVADPEAAPDATRLEVRAYDPLAFAVDPGTPPLAIAQVDPRSGTFRLLGIHVPATGFIMIVTDDWPGSGVDDFAFTATPYPVSPTVNLVAVPAYAITGPQDTAWTAAMGDLSLQAAGCDAGATLAVCGTWIGVFGVPDWSGGVATYEGVTVLQGPEPMEPPPLEQLFYLDPGYDSFTQPTGPADNFTGQTGTLFVPSGPLGNYSAECADLTPDSECEIQGYQWPGALGGSAPRAYFVQLVSPTGTQ